MNSYMKLLFTWIKRIITFIVLGCFALLIYFTSLLLVLSLILGMVVSEQDEAQSVDSNICSSVEWQEDHSLILFDDIKFEMKKIKAGSFIMGSSIWEKKRTIAEDQRRVILTKDFWIGKYEVTQAQYEAIMDKNPSHFKGSNCPVQNVSWYEARAFCEKLNREYADKLPKGYKFDLPTEAQWEYACRAGTITAFSYGDISDINKMNHDGKFPYGSSSKGIYRRSPVDVGSLGYKNDWGLYDMHGNVAEWCRDYLDEEVPDIVDPIGDMNGSFRAQRGGCYFSYAETCRSASRDCCVPTGQVEHIGFRLALVPSQLTKDIQKKYKKELKETKDIAQKVNCNNNVKLEMIKIKAGSFIMGSPQWEEERTPMEDQRRITLTKDFWLGKYEVTQAQYEAVMGENPSRFSGANKPVENVSWYDAKSFCEKLNKKYADKLPEGYKFDLPTEAQWEYACRAGTTTALNNGKKLTELADECKNLSEVAWYCKNCGREGPKEVGKKRPNNWGLYDMHGNVFEWCSNWNEYTNERVDPIGAQSGLARVYRGGGWASLPFSCRSPNRHADEPTYCNSSIGFRLALVPIR